MEPAWALVRATADFASGGRHFQRGELATVDLNDPAVKDKLRAQWFEPLPAAMQPKIEVKNGEPVLAEEASEEAPETEVEAAA